MHIRSATRHDVKAIRRLVLSLTGFYLPSNDSELPAWLAASLTREAFLQRIESPDFKHYLYESDLGVVAYIAIKNTNYLYHLFVAEAYQGRGIASRLWQHVVKYLDATVTLRSSLVAIPVYKKWGFVATGPLADKDGILFQPMALQRATMVQPG